MKKLILPMLACLLAFSTTLNATSKKVEDTQLTSKVVGVYEVNAFCKLIQMRNYDAVKAMIETREDANKKSIGLTP